MRMTTTSTRLGTHTFGNLLHEEFINRNVPNTIRPNVELIKGDMVPLSLSLFDPGKSDLKLNEKITFGQLFSQDIYGAGFTKGLANILAYLVCLDEQEELTQRDPEVKAFAAKVKEIADVVFNRLSSGDHSLKDVRQSTEKELDNFGGYYNRTLLQASTTSTVLPEGILEAPLMINAAGHLIAKVEDQLSNQLLNAYRAEIESHLSNEGKSHLQLPDNIGFVVVAYKEELAKISSETLKNILATTSSVKLSFKDPYVVPVRGDNRYSLVAAILVNSQDITDIRQKMSLAPLYSEGRPLRFTFGAVRNEACALNNEEVIARLRRSAALAPWLKWIEQRTTI